MSSKNETLTLSLAAGTKPKLEEIAHELGFFWGKSPSPSALVSAIANREIATGEPFYLSNEQVRALRQAIRALVDTGYVTEAETIARLVLDKGKLQPQIRQELLKLVNTHLDKWRLVVEEYIENKQPFEILYTNSQEQELIFNVHFARIDFRLGRFYLNIWCKETEDVSQDNQNYFPELIHNRCLRFDRIQGIIPKSGRTIQASGGTPDDMRSGYTTRVQCAKRYPLGIPWDASSQWRESLDYLEVGLQFTGPMVKAYKPREEDLEDLVDGKIRKITRKVFNPFWLVREVKGYGSNCKIIAPQGLLKFYQNELIEMCRQYNIEAKRLG